MALAWGPTSTMPAVTPSPRSTKKDLMMMQLPPPQSSKRSGIGLAFREWEKGSSIHGLSHARDSDERWAKALWMVVFVVGAVVTIWQVRRRVLGRK